MSSFGDNKPFWEDFIRTYRKCRELWDATSKDYSNRHIKKNAYLVLIEKAKEFIPAADENYVKSKIESLRASFRREFKKVQASKAKSGSAVYEPSLWYYELMLFTADREAARKKVAFPIAERSPPIENLADLEGQERSHSNLERAQSPSEVSSGTSTPNSVVQRPAKKGKSCFIEEKKERFSDIQKNALIEQSSAHMFGNLVAFQLEGLERRQRIIAEKLISDVLFHGRLCNLKESSIILPNNPRQSLERDPQLVVFTHPSPHIYTTQQPIGESPVICVPSFTTSITDKQYNEVPFVNADETMQSDKV